MRNVEPRITGHRESVRFFHLRTRNNGVAQDKGGITVAYKRRANGAYSITICQCNTNQRYDERLGEKVAAGRLEQGKFMVQGREDFIATLQTLHLKLSTGTVTKLDVSELMADAISEYDQRNAA